eukprot:764746-Hanusia_phi.AAC.3
MNTSAYQWRMAFQLVLRKLTETGISFVSQDHAALEVDVGADTCNVYPMSYPGSQVRNKHGMTSSLNKVAYLRICCTLVYARIRPCLLAAH